MEITVVNPEKVGDGMSAYMAYTVMTKTTIPDFKKPETTVRRRFSDFLGLHHRMAGKYSQKGRIVPPAPEKSMMGEGREGRGWNGMGGGRNRTGGDGTGQEGDRTGWEGD